MIYLLEDDESIRELVCYSLNKTGNASFGYATPAAYHKAKISLESEEGVGTSVTVAFPV